MGRSGRSAGRSSQPVNHPSPQRWKVWRSPSDQPAWARPALLAVTGVAALTYLWGISNFPLQSYYGGAVRSMGSSWRDFFFGAVDPRGTVTLDKLPGAFWIQALFVRIFGFHFWVLSFPQVIAGVLTVLVLYRTVRRVAGAEAGLVAAALLAASPATVLMNRGNVSDPWVVLFTVLAADAAIRAMTSNRWATLIISGLWVGVAFQTKMLQTWIILLVLLGVYLLAAREPLRGRAGTVLLAGVVAVVVSLSWMTVVTLVPAHDRPYVDGTTNDSVYTQVFVYNGLSRLGITWDHTSLTKKPPFIQDSFDTINQKASTFLIPAGWNRLLAGPLGRVGGWFLPASLVSLIAVLVTRRRAKRTDIMRASVIMWGAWLVLLFVLLSGGTGDHVGGGADPYYLGSLAPAEAALCAFGAVTAWKARRKHPVGTYCLLAGVVVTVLYDLYLVGSAEGYLGWIAMCGVILGLLAVLGLIYPRWPRWPTRWDPDAPRFILAAVALVFVPIVAVASSVSSDFGFNATPFQTAKATNANTTNVQQFQSDGSAIARLYAGADYNRPIVEAVDSGVFAAPLLMITGREFLPIGGFLGDASSPSLSELKHLVRTGQVSEFLVPITPPGSDPRTAWVRRSCRKQSATRYGPRVVMGLYDCSNVR